MGQVVQSAVTDVTESALARRRTRKPRQSQHNNAYITGNLTAFDPSLSKVTAKSPAVSATRNGSTTVSAHHGAQPVTESAANLSDHQTQASNDSLIARDTFTPRFGLRSKIATAVVAGLAAGAVVGSFWISDSQPEHALTTNNFPQDQPIGAQAITSQANNSQTNNSQANNSQEVVEKIPQEPQVSLLPDSVPPKPVDDAVAEELAAKRQQATQYQEEIEWLHIQNNSLQKEVQSLDSETTKLNSELLKLELAVTALESKPKPEVETRTVYNFVNVPVGGSVEQTDYPSPEIVDNYERENVDNFDDQYVDDYSDEYVFDYEEESVDNYGEENGDLPDEFLDYYSGDVVQTQEPVDSQSVSEQLIYDPASGYYINPQYVGPDEESIGPSDDSQEYPPVLYPDESQN